MHFGYYTDMEKSPVKAQQSDKLKRYLEGVHPYTAVKTVYAGQDVVFITPLQEDGKSITKDSLGDPILLTEDKKGQRVWLLPPKKYESIADFGKEYPPGHLDIRLTTGKEISIVPATQCPRLVSFATGGVSGFASPFGELARKLFEKAANEKDEEITFGDMAELTFYAVNQCYAVTRYLLDWINERDHLFTEVDYDMLYWVIMGLDPKKFSGSSLED